MNRRSVLSLALGRTAAWAGLLVAVRPGPAQAFSAGDANAALRAALERGAQVAVRQLGQADGFLSNDKVRIGLPEVLEKAAPVLRTVGQGGRLDELVTAMNHAAERAAALALPLLTQAIRAMPLQDAQKVLQGGNNAVVNHFSEHTRAQLGLQFKPVVSKVVAQFDLAGPYTALTTKATQSAALSGRPVSVQDHLTQKTLDGLYFVIGEEERRIRSDPAATGNALLIRVFGAL